MRLRAQLISIRGLIGSCLSWTISWRVASGAPGQGTPAWPFSAKCDPEIPLQEHPLLKYVFDGAFANLEEWASKGVAPPKAERITMKDGVAKGGVRNPYVDVPAASYTTTVPGPGTCRELGSTTPFETSKIDSLYGNHKKYEAKVRLPNPLTGW